MNELYDIYPKMYKKISSGNFDPFYRDDNLPLFFMYVYLNWPE